MSWLHHPKFRHVRDPILAGFRRKEFSFRKVKSVVFLCGGHKSPRRDRIAQYLKKSHSDLLVFYADDVWSVIADRPGLNALQMEAQLAGLADLVVIVVESPGTFAEVGAFSSSNDLRKKLLPLIDREYQSEDSFINTGPIRWINSDSIFAPTLWIRKDYILECVADLEDRLHRLPKPTAARVPDLSTSPKHLLFFVCDLISVFGPAPISHVDYYVNSILGKVPIIGVESLVGLAKAMNLVEEVSQSGLRMYYRVPENDRLPPFQRKKYLDLTKLRAQVLSVYYQIEETRSILKTLGERSLASK